MLIITCRGSRYDVQETGAPGLLLRGLDESAAIAAVVQLALAFERAVVYVHVPDLQLLMSYRLSLPALERLAREAGVGV